VAVDGTPSGDGPVRPPYRFEGILAAATRLERAAGPEGGPDEAPSASGGEEPGGSPPVRTPAGRRSRRGATREGFIDLTGDDGGEAPVAADRDRRHHRSVGRWVAMAVVAVAVSAVVLAFVDLRPGVSPEERATRCSDRVLEGDLGLVDDVPFVVSARACDGTYAYVRLAPADIDDAGTPSVFVTARHRDGAWEPLRHAWVEDCASEMAAVDAGFPLELCGRLT
jgi:hypothetical protein